jgi:hypothetical protein
LKMDDVRKWGVGNADASLSQGEDPSG